MRLLSYYLQRDTGVLGGDVSGTVWGTPRAKVQRGKTQQEALEKEVSSIYKGWGESRVKRWDWGQQGPV